jgi:hypothetical protein
MRKFSSALLFAFLVGALGCSPTAPVVEEPEDAAMDAAVEVAGAAKARRDPKAAWYKAIPRLAPADAAIEAARVNASKRVSDFFYARARKSRAFAREALDLESKWELFWSVLPFTDEGGHREYLRGRFEATVFSQKELADEIGAAVEEFMQAAKGIENRLLVEIRADLGDDELAGLNGGFSHGSDDAFAGVYAKAVRDAAEAAARDAGVTVGREAVVWAAADVASGIGVAVAAQVAKGMGVSAAVFGSGVGSSVATLGVGLVAAVVIDVVLDWVLGELGYDPVGDLGVETEVAIRHLRSVFLSGSVAPLPPLAREPTEAEKRLYAVYDARRQEWLRRNPGATCDAGFEYQLGRYCDARIRLRDRALRAMLTEGGSR